MTRRELHTRLLIYRLTEVLDQLGIDQRRYIGDDDEPYYLDDFDLEVAWTEIRCVYDAISGLLLRVR